MVKVRVICFNQDEVVGGFASIMILFISLNETDFPFMWVISEEPNWNRKSFILLGNLSNVGFLWGNN